MVKQGKDVGKEFGGFDDLEFDQMSYLDKYDYFFNSPELIPARHPPYRPELYGGDGVG